MSQALVVLIEITGNYRQGTSKAGNPYCMYEGYIHIPGKQYPVLNDFYAAMPNEVPQIGTYECDVLLEIRDGRLGVQIDPRQGRRKNLPPLSAAPKVAGA